MNCQNCSQPVEAGAAFCGNCGQVLAGTLPTATALTATMPAYALATPAQQRGETKAVLSLLLGVAGIVGGLFMALIGLVLGIAGFALGTMSRSSVKRGVSTAGIIVSSLAVLVGMGVWVYAYNHDQHVASASSHSNQTYAPTSLAADLSTPCYSIGFIDQFTVKNSSDSCDMNAFNGQTLDSSTNAYKVFAHKTSIATTNAFAGIAKQAIQKDMKSNLPNFTVDDEKITTFAGSPAYILNATDKANKVSLVEAAVFHKVGTGDNVFILVHANSGDSADLQILESQWQWK